VEQSGKDGGMDAAVTKAKKSPWMVIFWQRRNDKK
jgi:hypothetical protein